MPGWGKAAGIGVTRIGVVGAGPSGGESRLDWARPGDRDDGLRPQMTPIDGQGQTGCQTVGTSWCGN